MKFLIGSRRTLQWKLVSRIALMLGLLMIVLNLGIIGTLLWLLPDASQADYEIRPLIAGSLAEQDGRLVVKEQAVQELRDAAPGLWFIAAADDGRRVVFNQIPAFYESFVQNFENLRYVDVRGPDGSSLTAITADLDTDAGRLTVLYGGKTMPNPKFLELLWGAKYVYVPLIIAPMLIVFVAVPIIIGRALKGVGKTISQASEIDETRLGERLPKDEVVEELHPLVDGINAALGRIDAGMSRYQRFLANAAHELRTPVAILQTRIENLDSSPERERLMLDVIRLGATAEQLLDFERFSGAETVEDVDLVALCEAVAAEIAPLAIAAGYELGFEAGTARHVAQGDYASLERAVTNLAMNAIQHGNGKGRILIEVTETGTIEISDEGPGIPVDQRDKVFEPFYRVTPKSTGAGLGLSLVRQIAASHRGEVSFVDQARGARVRFAV